ncbi:MAG TPA: hypothetical protein VHV51_03805 [Polyangiaceae bacterium]|jgi:hypothetical protein|nr:hypothetical protein [Polyangiaceae bacterium]
MARPSRPPGFDMTYRPNESSFGPPFAARIPSFLYLAIAIAAAVAVVLAEHSPSNSWLYVNVVERGVKGFISARVCAGLLLLGAISSVLRTSMRGVRIRGDGVDYRDVASLGWPRARRFKWAQIDRIVLDLPYIALDLWDGTRSFLPAVDDRKALANVLEKVGHARAIPVRGGVGLDELPEAGEFGEVEEEA